MVRPEHVRLRPPGESLEGEIGVEGRVVDVVFAGDRLEIHVDADGRRILCMRPATAEPPPSIGSAVHAAWSRSDMLTY
jgi:ABC-type Fe3+/spermidine/putrescine transport system ATPase subunit